MLTSLKTIALITGSSVVAVSFLGTASAASPPANQADVVVYGGTPAGIIAAVAASRQRRTVTLIEPSRHVGGMTSGGLSSTDVGKRQVIGGLALEFFQRAAAAYGKELSVADNFDSEPHVAEATFTEMLREAGVAVVLGERLHADGGVQKDGPRIIALVTESGRTFHAHTFIDAGYEGDLMARAGVDYAVGRESQDQYGEPQAGYCPMPIRPRSQEVMGSECPCLGGDGPHYIHGTPAALAARDAAGRLLPGVEEAPPGMRPGDGDDRIQAYNFRVIVTREPGNRVPFPKPQRYDPARYELVLRLLDVYPGLRFSRLFHLAAIPGNKFDLNAAGLISTDYVGGNTGYPDGDYATRQQICRDHADYVQGLLWFLGHDQRLPERLRDEANQWGLCKDEFADNGHWPYQLYIRQGRRMIGPYVLKQQDLQVEIVKPDSVAMGSFVIDCHIVRRIATHEDQVTDEGSFQDVPVRPYQIPYRILVPRREQCTNLLVPVCVSATHVACCSVRMEPQYMMLGHAAGLAASAAVESDSAVQDVDVADLQEQLRSQGAVLALDIPVGPRSADLPGIVVDDQLAVLTGHWTVSTYTVGIDGWYRHDGNEDKGAKSARFDLHVPRNGWYEVRLAYSAYPNRASNVPVTIRSADGVTTEVVDQRRAPPDGLFRSLGKHRFATGEAASVTVSTEGTHGYVSIDAVQLLPSE